MSTIAARRLRTADSLRSAVMFTERGQGLIRWGTLLFFLSVVSGLAIPLAPDQLLMLAAHIQGLLNAFMILIVGLIWSRMEIGYLGSVAVYWGLIAGGLVTFAVQTACAFLEIGGSVFPIAGGGQTGTPGQEALVSALVRGSALVTLVAVALVLRGVLRKPAV